MARKEKPADPIFAGMGPDGRQQIPALSAPGIGDNSNHVDPGLISARGVKQIEFIERQIAALNTTKTMVYAEMTAYGLSKAAIKNKVRSRALDPIVAAEIKLRDEAYSRAIDDGLARIAMEEEAATNAQAIAAEEAADASAASEADQAEAAE